VFLSSEAQTADGDRIAIYLDSVSTTQAVIEHPATQAEPLESMRYLPAGVHRLRVESTGNPRHQSLVVRTMPELLYIRMCDQPGEPPNYRNLQVMLGGHVIPNYPIMTWDYLWPDMLRNCNSLSASYGARSRFKEKDRADAWKESGRKVMYEQVTPGIGSGTVTADSAYKFWSERDAFTDPRCDVIGMDEFGSYKQDKFDAWTEALRRLRANPKTADTQFLRSTITVATTENMRWNLPECWPARATSSGWKPICTKFRSGTPDPTSIQTYAATWMRGMSWFRVSGSA